MRLLRRIGVVASVLATLGLLCTVAPQRAEAKLLELQLRLHGGGMAGIYGTEDYDPAATDPDLRDLSGEDFFKARRGACFGGTLNVEVLFIDLTYEFYQLADGNGLSNTLNNFLIGFDWDFKAGRKWVVTPYLLAGFGLATKNNSWLSKSHPQISLVDLESRMVMTRIGIRFEYKLGRFFRLGFDIGGGYHYGINTVSSAANDLEGHSHGFHVIGNISLAFVWNVFQKKKKKKPTKVIIIQGGGGAGPAPAPGPGTQPAPGPGTTPAPDPRTTPAPAPPRRDTPDAVPPPNRPTEVPPATKKKKAPAPVNP